MPDDALAVSRGRQRIVAGWAPGAGGFALHRASPDGRRLLPPVTGPAVLLVTAGVVDVHDGGAGARLRAVTGADWAFEDADDHHRADALAGSADSTLLGTSTSCVVTIVS